MANSYSKFTIDEVLDSFSLKEELKPLFPDFQPIEPSDFILKSLKRGHDTAFMSEKARSEFIISPILLEIKELSNNSFIIYSGVTLKVEPKLGLTGECDFILSRGKAGYAIQTPIFMLVEAKDNDLELGIPQCIAQMVGAKKFNDKKGNVIEKIYGCVTTGEDWQFLMLEGNTIYIDTQRYYLDKLDNILGILSKMTV
jgi:hypothetical protein